MALAAAFDLKADTADNAALAAQKKWFREAQYGMMCHWGLYALLGGEWKGKVMPGIAEWVQSYFRIPNAEYSRLASIFNPIYFNADEWVQLARDAGMKYIVFTSKHHDGFAMFHSKVSKYNVVDATPFKRDVVGELAEACRKHGLKLGLYYSQDLDWHEPDGGGYLHADDWGGDGASWTNSWDFTDKAKKNFARYFEEKSKPQVREILTQYGDLALIWFDIGFTPTKEQSNNLYDMVRSLQPGCLINSRIGCGKCDYTSSGDNEIPTDDKSGMLYETCATINSSWGYKPTDQGWKSAETIRANREHLKKLGANYLLNVGPDARELPPQRRPRRAWTHSGKKRRRPLGRKGVTPRGATANQGLRGCCLTMTAKELAGMTFGTETASYVFSLSVSRHEHPAGRPLKDTSTSLSHVLATMSAKKPLPVAAAT